MLCVSFEGEKRERENSKADVWKFNTSGKTLREYHQCWEKDWNVNCMLKNGGSLNLRRKTGHAM